MNQVNTDIFPENLKTLRRVLGFAIKGDALSQKEFADLLGVTRRTLVYWEQGELPNQGHRQEILRLVKEHLQIDIDEKFLLTKDISKVIGPVSFFMYADLLKDLSEKKRQILQHLFLKLEHADTDTLAHILDMVDEFIG